MTTSSVIHSGMTTFGETQALVEAVTTTSGMAYGDPAARAAARGAARRLAEVLVVRVHMEDGALTQLAGAGHGVAP